MALVVAAAGSLKLEIRFAQAIKAFEADLPIEEQRELKSSSVPHALDVVRMTAQFNRALLNKNINRGFGARLVSFLESVHKFASIPDILIGGSQYLPACAVWTVVRFSLTAAVQVSAYVDKITTLFMEIGTFAPRYSNLGALYPHSRHLQEYLMEYHIVVVQLCHSMLKFAKSSSFSQFFGSFQSSVERYRDLLKRWAGAIADEVAVQTAQLVKFEAAQSANDRVLSHIEQEKKNQRRSQKMRHRLADLCSCYDFQKTFRELRKLGTATTFLKESAYVDFCDATQAKTLLYCGILGSGKSVLLASLIDDLFLRAQNDNSIVAYYFCRWDNSLSLTTETILGCLARQIIMSKALSDRDLDQFKDFLLDDVSGLSVDQICRLIRGAGYCCHQQIIFVLDGLDECSVETKDEVLSRLKHLQAGLSLCVCVSVRHEPDVASKIGPDQIVDPLAIVIPEANPDIERFIKTEIEFLRRTNRLKLTDDNLATEIEIVLTRSAKGMFLWVSLQLAALCLLNTDYEIRVALQVLPRSLEETYDRALRRDNGTRTFQSSLLLAVLVSAVRPLHLDELREVLSVEPGNIEYDPQKIITDIHATLSSCRGVIVVDEEDLSVRFVHYSVIQYVVEGQSMNMSRSDCERKFVALLLTYLNYPIFETQIAARRPPAADVGLVPNQILQSVVGSQRLVALMIRRAQKVSIDINNPEISRKPEHRKDISTRHPFLSYAKAFWFEHVLCLEAQDTTSLSLLKHACGKRRLDVREAFDKHPNLDTIFRKVSLDLFKCLIAEFPEHESKRGFAFQLAAKAGRKDILQFLIRSKVCSQDWLNKNGTGLLMAAAQSGSVPAFDAILVCNGFTVNERYADRKYWLQKQAESELASSAGGKDRRLIPGFVGRFLDRMYLDSDGRTALMHAAASGNFSLVKVILHMTTVDPGLEPAREDLDGNTALHHAAKNGQTKMIAFMLNHPCVVAQYLADSNVEQRAIFIKETYPKWKQGGNHLVAGDSLPKKYPWHGLLFCAIQGGHEETVEFVLDAQRKDPHSKDSVDSSLLTVAAELGFVVILKKILEQQDPDLVDHQAFSNALIGAAQYGQLHTVKMLLADLRVDPNVRSKEGLTPLMIAAWNNDSEILAFLLADQRVQVNLAQYSTEFPHGTALWLASSAESVCLLLERPELEIDCKAKDGTTILMDAIVEGFEEKVEYLLKIGMGDPSMKRSPFIGKDRSALEVAKRRLKLGWSPGSVHNIPRSMSLRKKPRLTGTEHVRVYTNIVAMLTEAAKKSETSSSKSAQKRPICMETAGF